MNTLKNNKFHFVLLFLVLFLYTNPIYSSDSIVDESIIECTHSACTVICGYPEGQLDPIEGVEKVNIQIFTNGVTKLEIEKGIMKGYQTLIVGPRGYICSVKGQ